MAAWANSLLARAQNLANNLLDEDGEEDVRKQQLLSAGAVQHHLLTQMDKFRACYPVQVDLSSKHNGGSG
jgi:hypothetical protein